MSSEPNVISLSRFLTLHGTVIGAMDLPGDHKIFTLEPAWVNNKRDVSCIPEGRYPLSVGLHKAKSYCVYVHDVPDRDNIQIHIGNYLWETQGCILPGMQFLMSGKNVMVQNSGAAMGLLVSWCRQAIRPSLDVRWQTYRVALPSLTYEVNNVE